MKKLLIAIMVAVFVLPTTALRAQEWQSTSTMQGAGSAYSSQVTPVGATSVADMSTTTTMDKPSGPRRINPVTPEGDPTPVGDAVLPLLLMAMACAGVIYLRKRKAQSKAQA